MNFREFGMGWMASLQLCTTPMTTVASRVNVNSKGSGNVVVHVSSHDTMQLAAAFLLPLGSMLLSRRRGDDIVY